jgi:hypothetical protein
LDIKRDMIDRSSVIGEAHQILVSPSPPNATGESECLRTSGAKFEPLVSIHRTEEIGGDKQDDGIWV